MTTNILLVEDEPAIQELISLNITQAGYSVLSASSAEIAQTMLKNLTPDLILVDWMLPGMSGYEMVRKLKSEGSTRNIPIIMLTARDDEYDKIRSLEAGVDDYVTKPFSPRELNARIKAILRRKQITVSDEPIEIAGLSLDPTIQHVTSNNSKTKIHLGPTEFKLLHFFMSNPERVHSRSQLLDKVWGDNVFVGDRTVDVHIRRLRNALSVSGHQSLLQTVRGTGYRFSVSF